MAKRYTGRIYKLEAEGCPLLYIGSTTTKLSSRMAAHRRDAKKKPHLPLYQTMNKYGVKNFSIVLLQLIENCTREQLKAAEYHYIQMLTQKTKA